MEGILVGWIWFGVGVGVGVGTWESSGVLDFDVGVLMGNDCCRC